MMDLGQQFNFCVKREWASNKSQKNAVWASGLFIRQSKKLRVYNAIKILADKGVGVRETCRQLGIGSATYYKVIKG